jgi:protein TonB
MLPAVPSEPLANLAGRLLGSADVAADGIDWGDAQDGSPGPMPGGSPDGLPGGTAQGSSNAPREIGGELLPPVRLFAPPPRYPDLARQVRLEGEVSIECVIDHRGSVEGARVVSGPALLHQAALEAVTRWRYAPTRLNGEPVPVRLVVTVRFELR